MNMASSDQIKSLIKAHLDQDDEKFKTVVLQIAASEAKQGHEIVARELKKYVDNMTRHKNNIIKMNNDDSMFLTLMPNDRLSDLIVSKDLEERIKRILREYRNKNKLKQYGYGNRRKILLEGNPGTGKTFTASVIASELGLPLHIVQMDKVVTKFMGETSAKLRRIFDSIDTSIGVYLFDEFDAIGADRGLDNEVGEARRILNSFLQFIEQDESDSIIVAATNNQQILDQALFRRFDDVLHYLMPSEREIERLFEFKLEEYCPDFVPGEALLTAARNLSQAEIIRVCDDAIKDLILYGGEITEERLLSFVYERKLAYIPREA